MTSVQIKFVPTNLSITISMQPNDCLTKLIDSAREKWKLDPDLALCLTRQQGNVATRVDNLEQTFEESRLGRTALLLDYTSEAKIVADERLQQARVRTYNLQQAEHRKWRETARPVDVFRYDLQQHAKTLDLALARATDTELHYLFNTRGILSIHNMIAGALETNPAHCGGPNMEAFQKYGTCRDGRPYCSQAAREKNFEVVDRNLSSGGVPKAGSRPMLSSPIRSPAAVSRGADATGRLVPTVHGQEGSTAQSPIRVFDNELGDKAGGGNASPPPKLEDTTPPPPIPPPIPRLPTETLGFGEIIQPSIKHDHVELPAVSNRMVIASFEKVILKFGQSEAIECKCDVYIDEQKQPLVRCYKPELFKSISLTWLKKEREGAGAAAESVPINDALKPHSASSSSFCMLLKLDHGGELLMQFGGDSDVLKWQRVIKHVYSHFHAFSGEGRKLHESPLHLEQNKPYIQAYQYAAQCSNPELLAEGLLFGSQSSGLGAENAADDGGFKQDMEDFIQLRELNAYHTAKAHKMTQLQEKKARFMQAGGANQAEIDQVCSEIEKVTVMNLEMFRLTQERQNLQRWLDSDENIRSPLYSKVKVKIDLLTKEVDRLMDEKLLQRPIVSSADQLLREAELGELRKALTLQQKSAIDTEQALKLQMQKYAQEDQKRIPFQYEDVLIQVRFDGFPGAELHTALAVFPKGGRVLDIISWLYHRVFDMSALVVPVDDASVLPFSLNRNGVLSPETVIGSIAAPPTSRITCRVKLRDPSGARLPFRSQVKGAEELNKWVGKLFPKKKETSAEIERIAKVREDQMKKADLALFDKNLENHALFKKAQGADRPVLWRFRLHDGKVEEGSMTCDNLRDVLNQGHFDHPSEYGKILPSYEFSFDGSTWQSFATHSQFLAGINAQAITRTLNAVDTAFRAAVAAAFQTFCRMEPPAFKVESSQSVTHGSLSAELPSLPDANMPEDKKGSVFAGLKAAVDQKRVARKLPPLFADTCRVCNEPAKPLRVEFHFPRFLSLDLIMRRSEGLQKDLEFVIFDLYFQQKLVQPRGGERLR